jgi:peroxiredoxin
MLPILRVSLAGVFALAGLAKLLDRAGTRRSLVDFGLAEHLVPAAAIGLPFAELAVAIALLPSGTAVVGAAGAAALLLLFIAAIGASLLRGQRPDCHCFGQLHSEPIGWSLLARNGALLVAASVVVTAGWPDGGGSVLSWFWSLPTVARLVVGSALVALAIFAAKRLAWPDKMAVPPSPPTLSALTLPVGTPAPRFSLPTLDGANVSLQALLAQQKPVLLIFTSPACGPCTRLLPDIEGWQRDHAAAVTIAVVTNGTVEENLDKLRGRAISNVMRQTLREVAESFGVLVTPAAVLVGTDGAIARVPAIGDAAVKQYVDDIVNGTPAAAVPHLPAPDFTLLDLGGHLVSLSEQRGRPTVVLFWSPGCPHCDELLGHLRLWEARPLDRRPQMLLVSTGTAADIATLGLQSTTLLDRGFGVGRRYGLTGTPSAVLVDEEGRVAREPAVGSAAILELIGQSMPPPASTACPPEDAAANADLTELPADSRPMRHGYVHDELLADGSLLLYNSCSRQVLTLNLTGALVWECCDGKHDVAGIVAEVDAVFPAAPTVDADVRGLLDSLLRGGLIAARPTAQTTAPVPAESH